MKTAERTIEEVGKFLRYRICGWYGNAKEDYGVNGKYVSSVKKGNNLIIYHDEEGCLYATSIPYPETFTNEQIYTIWMESEWEVVK